MPTRLYTRTDSAGSTTLRIFGKLDVLTASELKAVIDELVHEQCPSVVVDLESLDLIDSSGVAAIVALYKRIRAGGGQVKVTGARNQPLAIFKVLRMDRVFGL